MFLKNLFINMFQPTEKNELFWMNYKATVNLYQRLKPSKDFELFLENCSVFFLHNERYHYELIF